MAVKAVSGYSPCHKKEVVEIKKYRISEGGELLLAGYTTEGEIEESKGVPLVKITDLGEAFAVERKRGQSDETVRRQVIRAIIRKAINEGLDEILIPERMRQLALSVKKAFPHWSDKQVAIFVEGRFPIRQETMTLAESIRRVHPDWTDRQVEIFVNGR